MDRKRVADKYRALGYWDRSISTSARDKAPQIVRRPPTTQTNRTSRSESNCLAMAPPIRKIPDPIIIPTTIAMPSNRVNSLRKLAGETSPRR